MVAPARASLVSLVASLLLACNSPAAGRMLATTSAAAARAGPPPAPLPAAPAVRRLPTGSTTPRGWLLRQLVIQAEGLSGHLTKFWPKVANSAWFGGTAPFYIANNSCGDAPCPKANNISQTDLLHQEAPYWLNGFVPLAVLLRNARIDELPPNGPGLPTIRPMEQVEQHVEYILSHAGASPCGAATGSCAQPPPGWLGPYDLGLAGSMYWGSFPALLALQQYAEGETLPVHCPSTAFPLPFHCLSTALHRSFHRAALGLLLPSERRPCSQTTTVHAGKIDYTQHEWP